MKFAKRSVFRAAERILDNWERKMGLPKSVRDTMASEIADEFVKLGMSVGLRKVHDEALKRDAKLRADDDRFNNYVQIIHEDGSAMFFHYAFLESWGDWLMCFTEHNGLHVFPKCDLERWAEFERTKAGDQYHESEE